ncbi:tetratricopeptide repeat protein, partial [Calothrix sp. 336/3]|uniref:tetratricopeptide repeat protein n=1 Tax=Calothrix sp. 336/3 TaxID=1337936 RepID=UPI00054EB5E6
MYTQARNVVCVLLLSSVFISVPSVVYGEVVVAQKTNDYVKQLLDEGRRLVDSGDFNGAIAVYQQAANLEPRNASIHSGIGYAYVQQNNFPAALSAFRRASALNPNNSDFHYAIGYISGNLGDYQGAKDAYRRAIQANRGNANAYVGLATILVRLGEYVNAKWAYDQAANIDPRNPQLDELRGVILKR